MKRVWSFFSNPFLVATDGSYQNAYQISNYHFAALSAAQGNPFFAALLAFYLPLHLAFETAYQQWTLQGGQQISETMNVKQLYKELNQKIKKWDILIQAVYADNTPAYNRLLPYKRSPFQTGTQINRLNALKVLIDAIGDDPNLTKIKDEMQAFYNIIKAAFDAQKAALSTTGNNSNDVEAARIAMCIGQYANLGAMMNQFAANPESVEGYFDVEHIRNGSQSAFEKQLKPNEVHFIAKRTLKADDEIELENTGTGTIGFFIADKKTATTGAVVVSVAAGEIKTIKASDLGDVATLHFLIVKNEDAVNDGSFELYFV